MSLNKLKIKQKIINSLPERYHFRKICRIRQKTKEAPSCICPNGSMTVEAAVIIPLLTCLLVFILFFLRIMQVQLVVQSALQNTGRKLSVYTSLLEKTKDDAEQTGSEANYRVAAKSLFVLNAGKSELIERFVQGGITGVSLLESEFSGDEIYLKASYQMKFPVDLFGKKAFYITQNSLHRKWTGWSDANLKDGEVWVYITKNGRVYHKTSSCTYLKLSIQSVEEGNITQYRNENGQKYRKCNECAEKDGVFSKVYITNYGDCYHRDLNCGGIKRTIEIIRLSEAGGKGACSKCWN